jgi:hypothetical protein
LFAKRYICVNRTIASPTSWLLQFFAFQRSPTPASYTPSTPPKPRVCILIFQTTFVLMPHSLGVILQHFEREVHHGQGQVVEEKS